MAAKEVPERKDKKIGGPMSSFGLNRAPAEEEKGKGNWAKQVSSGRPSIDRCARAEKMEKAEWLSPASRAKEEGGEEDGEESLLPRLMPRRRLR